MAQPNQAQAETKQTFDGGGFVQNELGYKIVGAGSRPGSVKVEIPMQMSAPLQAASDKMLGAAVGGDPEYQETQEEVAKRQPTEVKELDLHAMMANELGIDPRKVNLKWNDPTSAVDDSPMGFLDRFKYEIAGNPKDKAKFLAQKFGSENIKFDPDKKEFMVNDRGVWHNADKTGLAGYLGGEGDTMVGTVNGAMVGGTLGAAAGPVGAFAGATLGAGIGAVLSRFHTIDMAQDAGLRTEQDAEEIKQELGWEFLKGVAAETGGRVVAGAAKGVLQGANYLVEKAAAKLTNPAAKRWVAETMSGLLNTDPVDNHTWLDFPKQTQKYQKMAIAYKEAGERGINPVQREMANEVQTAVTKAKETIHSTYQKTMESLAPITKDVKVDMRPVIKDLQQQYKELGLLDGDGRWLEAGEQKLAKVVDPSSVAKLKQTYQIMKRSVGQVQTEAEKQFAKGKLAPGVLLDESGKPINVNAVNGKNFQLSFDEATTVKRNLDEILEAAGQYNSDGQITTPAKARIVAMRQKLNGTIHEALKAKSPEAAAIEARARDAFSTSREWLDDMLPMTKDARVDSTVKKLVSQEGSRTREMMSEVLKDTGINAEEFVNGLYQRRAGMNTARFYKHDKGSSLFEMAGGMLGSNSPRKTTPMMASTFNRIQKMAQGNEFLRNLPPSKRDLMLKNPALLSIFSKIITTNADLEDQLPGQLMQMAQPQEQ